MNILITGTSSGIGKKIAQYFLSKNHIVYALDIQESNIEHINYKHFVHDIRDKNFPKIENLEVLINNAGIQSASMDDIYVNLIGTINVSEHYALQENIKAVVNIVSASATSGSEFPEYAAAKGGVLTYTKNLALRLAKYGAVCNSISPGGVITSSNAHILDNPELYQKVLGESLLNKWAEEEEIAKFVYFVAVENKSMTGQDILIDNGEWLKSNFIW